MWVDSWRPANPIFPSLCLPSSSHLISPRLCCLPSTHRRLVFNHVLPSLLTLPAQHKQRVQHCWLHCVCVCVCVCLFVLVGLGLLFQLLGQSSRLLRTSETSSLNYAGTSFSSTPSFVLHINTHFYFLSTQTQIFCWAINPLTLASLYSRHDCQMQNAATWGYWQRTGLFWGSTILLNLSSLLPV